jgi:hypothetical protein
MTALFTKTIYIKHEQVLFEVSVLYALNYYLQDNIESLMNKEDIQIRSIVSPLRRDAILPK